MYIYACIYVYASFLFCICHCISLYVSCMTSPLFFADIQGAVRLDAKRENDSSEYLSSRVHALS